MIYTPDTVVTYEILASYSSRRHRRLLATLIRPSYLRFRSSAIAVYVLPQLGGICTVSGLSIIGTYRASRRWNPESRQQLRTSTCSKHAMAAHMPRIYLHSLATFTHAHVRAIYTDCYVRRSAASAAQQRVHTYVRA